MPNLGLNMDDLYTDVSNFNALLYNKQYQLEEAKKTNKARIKIEAKHKQVQEVRFKIERHLSELKIFEKLVKREDADYKENRKHFIEAQIEESVAIIFPTRNYKVNLDRKVFRGKIKVKLKLKNKFGRTCTPKMGEGKLCQQLISFSASTAVSKSYGLDKVFTDESFSASSPENLTKVGEIVKDAIDHGLQIILIEQQDTIYKDISRREIHLEIDKLTLDLKEPVVIDY